MKEIGHLPLLGVGPVIIAGQVLITVMGIIASYRGYFDAGKIAWMNIPLKIVGVGLMVFGFFCPSDKV